jgi:uncharacterized protein YidB (DUF937 family)
MGFLDSLTWHVLGGGSGQVALYNAILDVVDRHPEGMGGIVRQFKEVGLEHLIDSWVSTGDNLPATPDQIRNGLGVITILGIARRTGMTEEEVTARLTTLLPRVIDTLTPKGVVPAGPLTPNRLTFLSGMTL